MTFRDWPSKVVVEGSDPDTNTYIGYSPVAGARLASAAWVVEKVDASGANSFATVCLEPGEAEPQPCATMDDPADLDYTARAAEEVS
jgi:hypothetical protein